MKKLLAVTLVCYMSFFSIGCTKAQVDKTVALIGAELPTALQLAVQISTLVAAFGLSPSDQAQETKVTGLVVTDLKELETLVASYQAHPAPDTYSQIIKVVNDVVANSEQQLFEASLISDPVSKQRATAILGSMNAMLLIIDGYVQATQPTSVVKNTANTRKVKMAAMRSSLDKPYMEQKLRQHGVTFDQYYSHEVSLGF